MKDNKPGKKQTKKEEPHQKYDRAFQSLFEEFREESKFIGRIFREKVPNKQLYIIMKRKGEGTFPEILDSTSNIRTASNKILKYSIRWIGELKKKEGNLDLLLDYKIIDNTYIKLRQEYNKKFS